MNHHIHSSVRAMLAAITIGSVGLSYADQGFDSQIDSIFGDQGIKLIVPTSENVRSHTAHFSSPSVAALGTLVGQFASSASDVPAVSTVPGMTYRYDPDLQAFAPSSGSLGPVYVERPQTTGQGHFSVGVAYEYINFTTINGQNLNGLTFAGLTHPPVPGHPAYENDTADITFNRFNLESHVISLYSTYGITDNWDVNIVLPVIQSTLQVNATATLNNMSGAIVHQFADGSSTQNTGFSGSHTGIGDILLRTKYRFLSSSDFNAASGLTVRIPSGDKHYFQGLGDVTVYPYFALSKEIGPFDFHLTGGVDINATNTERSRVRYAGGLTLKIIDQVAFLADVIGNANATTQTISVNVPIFDTVGNVTGHETQSKNSWTNIVDLNLGFKAAFGKTLVGFAGVLVPVNNSGLRPDVVPTAVLQGTF